MSYALNIFYKLSYLLKITSNRFRLIKLVSENYLLINSKSSFADLKGKKSVYMITSVLMAKTIEFRVTRQTSSRIFHLGNASPLVFGLEEFVIGEDGKLTAKVCYFYISMIPVKFMESLNWTIKLFC